MATRFFEPVRARTVTKILTGTQVRITTPDAAARCVAEYRPY